MKAFVGRLWEVVSNHPFGSAASIFVILILLVWYCSWPTLTPDREYVATRKLVNNHRIVPGDLRRPDTFASWLGFYMPVMASIEGKYVSGSAAIMPDQPVYAAILADRPKMDLPKGMCAVVFMPSADARYMGLLDVGQPVVLLGQDPDSKSPVAIDATVHAILCEPTTGDAKTCYPVLRVAEGQSQLVTKNQSALRLALSSDP